LCFRFTSISSYLVFHRVPRSFANIYSDSPEKNPLPAKGRFRRQARCGKLGKTAPLQPETAFPGKEGWMLDKEKMKEEIMEALGEVNDPELGIDIVNLGLVYGVDIDDEGNVKVTMTLTAIGCPLAGMINGAVTEAVKRVDGVKDVEVNIVWDPPWTKDRMSRYAKI